MRRRILAGAALVALLILGLLGGGAVSGDAARAIRTCATVTSTVVSTVYSTVTQTVTVTDTGGTTTAPPPPPPYVQGTGLIRMGSSYPAIYGGSDQRAEYVIAGPADYAKVAAIPGVSLVYKAAPQVYNNTNTDQSGIVSGVSWADAVANGWLLTNSSGNYIQNTDGSYLLDVGSASYQAAFARNVGDWLIAKGVDGVFIDNIIASLAFMTVNGVYPTKYPTQADWQAAMVSFVQSVGPALKARGLYVAANAIKFIPNDSRSDNGVFEQEWFQTVGPYLSGLMAEYWLQWTNNLTLLRVDTTTDTPGFFPYWAGWFGAIDAAHAAGADFLGEMEAPSPGNDHIARYGRANMLLKWQPGDTFFFNVRDNTIDPWDAAWTQDVGAPLGGMVTFANDVRKRAFTNYTVYVNPTASSQTADGLTIPAADALFVAP